jgi:DNA-binding transcriptional ArsR family regulator
LVQRPIQEVKADLFKAMAHPARIRILELLSDRDWPVSALIGEVGLEASHLSQQLGVLRRANLVAARKEGTAMIYTLVDRRIARLLELARQILLDYLTTTRDLLAGVKS